MEYLGPSGRLKAREQFTVRRPASLRIDAMSPLGVALIVAADGSQIAIFNPSDNTLIKGPASAATLARFTQIPMAPEQAAQLLLALPPEESLLTTAPSSSRNEDDLKILSYSGVDGGYELEFSGGELVLVRAHDKSGHETYEVHYSDYHDIGAMKFPFELQARFVATGTTIKLRYLNPSIDRQIADSTFMLSPGPGTRVIELGLTTPSSLVAGPA
jgi:outer membrane lipoprotein-sorting protein